MSGCCLNNVSEAVDINVIVVCCLKRMVRRQVISNEILESCLLFVVVVEFCPGTRRVSVAKSDCTRIGR